MSLHDLATLIQDYRTLASLTDAEVIGASLQECDRGKDFTAGDNNYTWWHAIGQVVKPAYVVEIGVRYGYSLLALLSAPSTRRPRVLAIDAEADHGEKTLTVFEQNLRREFPRADYRVINRDSQTLEALPLLWRFDVGSVDGLHSEAGCYHDCKLVFDALRPGGLMVVDDTLAGGEVRAGCERFCRERGLDWEYLPSLRGIHLVLKPRESE